MPGHGARQGTPHPPSFENALLGAWYVAKKPVLCMPDLSLHHAQPKAICTMSTCSPVRVRGQHLI